MRQPRRGGHINSVEPRKPLAAPLGRGIVHGMSLKDLAFDHAPIGLALLENRIIRLCNLQFASIFGDAPSDYENVPLARYYPSIEDYRRIGALGLQAMRDTGRYNDERIMKRRDGTLFWCRVRGQSLTPKTRFHAASGRSPICRKNGLWSN